MIFRQTQLALYAAILMLAFAVSAET